MRCFLMAILRSLCGMPGILEACDGAWPKEGMDSSEKHFLNIMMPFCANPTDINVKTIVSNRRTLIFITIKCMPLLLLLSKQTRYTEEEHKKLHFRSFLFSRLKNSLYFVVDNFPPKTMRQHILMKLFLLVLLVQLLRNSLSHSKSLFFNQQIKCSANIFPLTPSLFPQFLQETFTLLY